MCAFIEVMVSAQKLSKKLGTKIHELDIKDRITFKAKGFAKTDKIPVLYAENDIIKYSEMNWSLCPKWSKEFPVKWNTYNARMTRIGINGEEQKVFEAPSFRDSFHENKFCLIPISSAYEFCYWGKHAGKKVKFGVENDIFLAVGLWSEWVSKEGDVIETCTLLTDDPYKYFFEMGHDRSIIVTDRDKSLELLNEKRKAEDSFNLIRDSRITLPWVSEEVASMKEGWQKRAPGKKEIEEIEKSVF